jgi:hypothetical protein
VEPVRHSVTWRIATQDELERTGCEGQANLTDGAAAILVDGELRGITNEYGTCIWSAYDGPEDVKGSQTEAIERLSEAAGEL